MASLLELNDLGCARAGRRLFQGLTLALQAGELLVVRGANGSGKTSLLRLICGLLSPDRGEVRWRGQALPSAREALGREQIYLAHQAALAAELTPLENLAWAQAMAGHPCDERELRQALEETGLPAVGQRPVRELSQGQRQRCALARLALPARRTLWVLDEPFNALDAQARQWLLGRIEAHRRQGGVVALSDHQSHLFEGASMRTVSL